MVFSHIRYYTREVPFEYTCEHCGKDSGTQIAEFRIGARSDWKWLTLSDKADQKLTLDAQKSMSKFMTKYRTDVEEKHKFSDFFPNQCPHCGKKQVWGKGNIKRNQFLFALACAGAGVIASFFVNRSGSFNLALLMFFAFLGAFAGMIIGPILFHLKQSAFPPRPKHIPVVHWPNDIEI